MRLPVRLFPFVIKVPWIVYSGMAIFPFILVKSDALKNDTTLIHHEKIHLTQQIELLILPFYVAYLFNYLINLTIYKNHTAAYREIVFEREAYANEGNIHYLSQRSVWSFIKYV